MQQYKMPPKSHSLDALLNSSSQLKQLASIARQLQRLREQVRGQLPPNLVGHFLGAQYRDGTLVIYMDSSASATLLRYQQRELAYRLAAALLPSTHIKIQVAHPPAVAVASKPAVRSLPAAARAMLESAAAGLEDGPLSRSLRRLARRRNPRQ
jgi:hypothetical protein